MARVYVILNAKRGKEILQGAWLFYAPRTKHFNVGPDTIPNDVPTTPSCLSIIASLYDLSISAPARTRNNDRAQFACETPH